MMSDEDPRLAPADTEPPEDPRVEAVRRMVHLEGRRDSARMEADRLSKAVHVAEEEYRQAAGEVRALLGIDTAEVAVSMAAPQPARGHW